MTRHEPDSRPTPPRRQRIPLCVRCGKEPRDDGGIFLCGGCRVLRKTSAEVTKAVALDSAHPRLVLIQRFGWVGGWTRKEVAKAPEAPAEPTA